MDTQPKPVLRIATIDPRVVDAACAALGAVGAVLDASSQPHRNLGAPAIAPLLVLMGSVAWRRANPATTTILASLALIVFVLASGYNGDGSFEAAAIALNFYILGQRSRGHSRLVMPAVAFGCWLVTAVVISSIGEVPSVGSVLGTWALFGPLPFAFGYALATGSELTRDYETRTARLDEEHELSARRAAAEERNRMARELHDVIAHCMSVMVVQAGAARRVARNDVQAARAALQVVEASGREALVELRRIVGVLHRGSEELAGATSPGLAQLGVLADRANAAGLSVELSIDGQTVVGLSPGIELVAYRIVQEALTNAIKHAGPARATATVRIARDELELQVSDSGHRPARKRARNNGSEQGLVGMRERVALYGGELRAGRGERGGFTVHARIPLRGTSRPGHDPVSSGEARRSSTQDELREGVRWPWLDPLLAGVLLVIFELEVLSVESGRGPLLANLALVAGMALAAGWRRRWPLAFVAVLGACGTVMYVWLTPMQHLPLLAAYFLLVPAYTVAAWADRGKAVFGLALLIGGAATSELTAHDPALGDLLGAIFVISAPWMAGRLIRTRRAVNSELGRTSTRLLTERDDRTRLAVAGERSRIAGELHTLVARSVAVMVVQAEGALTQLDRDDVSANAAMEAIENTGREGLAEMRRILGVLRHSDEHHELHPRPGVDHVYRLIQRTRERGQPVELSVGGDPGTLPAGVDLGIYRILEDALDSARQRPASPVGVSLSFGEQDIELHVTARLRHPSVWPTNAIRERVQLCEGDLHVGAETDDLCRLSARLPRARRGAFV